MCEEIQIQGRTARQGKSGTYSLIIAEAEIAELGLQSASLGTMQADQIYKVLCNAREKNQAMYSNKMEEVLKTANALDDQSHSYFDALLHANHQVATERLRELYTQLCCSKGAGAYHIVCCYDESGSMVGQPWADLESAHCSCMRTLQNMSSVKVSIVQFGSHARVALQFATPAEASRMHLSFGNGSSTLFKPPLAQAHQLLRACQQSYPELTPVLLFMSDGANADGNCAPNITQMQEEFPSLVFHAVIFNQEDSLRLREMVNAASNGHFHVSADGVKLSETFSAIASSLEYTGR